MKVTETIAAIASSAGDSGIGIIRISGDEAIEIADKVFCSSSNCFFLRLFYLSGCHEWMCKENSKNAFTTGNISPLGETATDPTLGPSGRQLLLNCCAKKRL